MKFTTTVECDDFDDFVELTKRLTGQYGPVCGDPLGQNAPQTGTAVKPATDPCQQSLPVETNQQPTVTLAQVRTELSRYMEGPLAQGLKDLIKAFGAKSLATIPAEKLSDYFNQARAYIAANQPKDAA